MTQMVIYLMAGLAVGLVIGGLMIYLLPYRTLRGENARTVAELTEFQARCNELQSTLLEEQSKGYQGRQTMLLRQKRLESDLAEASERMAEMDRQHADFKQRGEQQLQTHRQEAVELHEKIDRLEQEQAELQDRLAQKEVAAREERQSLSLLNSQLDDEVKTLRRDREQLSTRLEQQQDTWEQERLSLQIQMNTLEDNLSLQKVQGGSGLSPDTERMMGQWQTELAELRKQRTNWEEERQVFQEQFKRLQAERRSLRTQVAQGSGESANSVGADTLELRQQLDEAQKKYQTLKEKLAAHDLQAQQKYGALEAEIEQLMERLVREPSRGADSPGANYG
ncbi:MAG: hypothetical protein QG599_530 [Pseudomonadota bacterium]|nr:hypothetical protein [Pseudomonadota bacterium]